jgi:hypothetical protein
MRQDEFKISVCTSPRRRQKTAKHMQLEASRSRPMREVQASQLSSPCGLGQQARCMSFHHWRARGDQGAKSGRRGYYIWLGRDVWEGYTAACQYTQVVPYRPSFSGFFVPAVAREHCLKYVTLIASRTHLDESWQGQMIVNYLPLNELCLPTLIIMLHSMTHDLPGRSKSCALLSEIPLLY